MQYKSFLILFMVGLVVSCKRPSENIPNRVIAELTLGETRKITLSNDEQVTISLLEIHAVRDSLRNAIRDVHVTVSVDGEKVILESGNYHLPVEVGIVQIDCPVVKEYYTNSNSDRWGLSADVRFRLWPKDSPWIEPGTFVYPLKQRWFASMTHSGNEPCFVDWGENLARKDIYYHSGHDFGGAEGMDEIMAAMDGLVISARGDTLEGYTDFPGDIRPDVVWILNDLGWYMRYSHLDSTDPGIQTGNRVSKGQRVGMMGKQGHSGGWVHLHFEIKNRETASGAWGTEEAYAYLWEAYVRQYEPDMIAVARPHKLLWTGQKTILDGSKSRCLSGDIASYQWILSDGKNASGATVERVYTEPGEYSEILKIKDTEGNMDYDFTVVQVYDRENSGQKIPVLQPAYHPSLGIKAGDPVTFLVRSFNVETGNEVWDFGDGSPKVSVKSEAPDRRNYTKGKFAETLHEFEKPGDYIVTVQRSNEEGIRATAHLHVVVEE